MHNFDWSLSQNKLTLFALSFAFVFSLGSNATWLEKLELFPPYCHDIITTSIDVTGTRT